MAQKTYNILNYGKEYKQAFLELLSDTTTRITLPDEIDGVQYSLGKERWDGDTSLQYIDFNKCDIIPARTCNECANLTQAVFSTHTTTVGREAFYGCTKFEDTELPHTLTEIGQQAFYNVGSYYERGTHTFTMIDDVGVHTTIGMQAFSYSHLSTLQAYTNDIGGNAFQYCSSLTNVDIEIHGQLNGYAFAQCQYMMNFRINPNSVITFISNNVFEFLGYQTYSDPNFHIADFDFRNSTFTGLYGNEWNSCWFNGVIYFPRTLNSIMGNFLNNARGNWKLYFNSIPAVSSSSYLRSDDLNFTVKYYFPAELLEQAKQSTNWSSHTSQMFAWIEGIPVGEEIQPYTKDSGYAITWYSDTAMTQVATTSAGPSNVYYGEITGSVREAWSVNKILLDASVIISDGTNVYNNFVPLNTTITITPNYTDSSKNQLFLFEVNGVDYTSAGTVTLQTSENLEIVALYYDGINPPFYETLEDNSWEIIKLMSKLGVVPSSWQVGDIKTVTYDNVVYAARLVDKTGKFKRSADNSTAYFYFEFTDLLTTVEAYNPSFGNNRPAESPLLVNMNSGDIWNKMDASLKSVIENVDVKVGRGGGSGYDNVVVDLPFKFFLAREHDLYSTRDSSTAAEWNLITQDQYYQVNDNNNAKRKHAPGGSFTRHALLSPAAGQSHMSCIILESGANTRNAANYAYNVPVRFAL